ncbi:MAG: tetratricopeptide repeat protein [Bacteroidales bacterium]|nr:tetratricopeptide repeat protein [Bacteroidales bacterium]
MKKIVFLLAVAPLFYWGCTNSGGEDAMTGRDSAIVSVQNLEKRLYADSSQTIKPGVAMETMIAYARFAHDFPTDSLSPEYLFKAAEIARALHNGQEAVLYYDKICTDYPNYEKTPTSLFLKAFTYENILKDTVNAKVGYQEFIEKYPNNQFADDAQYSLKYLGKSPEELIKMFEGNEDAVAENPEK